MNNTELLTEAHSPCVKLIILNNKICKIYNADEALLKKIRRLLSFRPDGIEYTPAYKNGWDGITYLLNKKNEFPLGLLDNVKAYLNISNKKFVVEGTIPVINNPEISINDKLVSLDKIPRDYRIEIMESVSRTNNGIIRAATGSGKSLVTAMITAKINQHTNLYVIGLDLLQQFHDLFSDIFDEPIGFIGNGVCDVHRINIVSVWTAGRALGVKEKYTYEYINCDEKDNSNNYFEIIKCLRTARLHLFDECHRITSDTMKSIYNTINPERIYGLSGTPYKNDGTNLLISSILGPQIIDIPASRLIEAKWLAQPIIKFVRVPKLHIASNATYQTIYKEYITENEVRNSLIIKNAKDLLTKNYQVLILFKHLAHGKNLAALFDAENIKYEYLSGTDSLEKRMEVKNRLLNNESNLVLASSIYDQGIDVPSLSALILAGSGKSSTLTLQRIGRTIRIHKNKKYAAIVDFYDDVRYLKNHSKIRYKIYRSEDGFKLIIPKNIPELK